MGSRLVLKLNEDPDTVIDVFDNQWFGNPLPKLDRVHLIKDDIRNIDNYDVSGYDVIYHLANIANDPAVDLNRQLSWDVNVLATMRLMDKAARGGVSHFIFASSASVYGVKEEENVTEDLDLYPISEYNKTKMIAERVLLSYANDMLVTAIRPATVCGYSDRMRLDITVNMFTIQALKNGVMTVFGGDQVRPNIHIDDLVDAYLHVQKNKLTGIFNVGFENASIKEITQMVSSQVDATIETTPSNDPRSYRVNSDKILATGFKPKKSIKTSITEMIDAYKVGSIVDKAQCYNVRWMKENNFS